MALNRWIIAAVAVVTLAGALAYLRDPPWLLDLTTGFSAWEADEAGVPYRWTGGRASFFVPADARGFVLTARALKDAPSDWPINATITVDDDVADVVAFPDEAWRDIRVELPPRGSRNARRIDIKLDRLRLRDRGLQVRKLRMER